MYHCKFSQATGGDSDPVGMDYYGGLGTWFTFTFSEVDFKAIIDSLNSIVVVVILSCLCSLCNRWK